jgi:hypothetical protein
MHFATRVRTWRVARLYSETTLSRKPFGIGQMYKYTFLFTMAYSMTSQNIDHSSWDALYIHIYIQVEEILKNTSSYSEILKFIRQ